MNNGLLSAEGEVFRVPLLYTLFTFSNLLYHKHIYDHTLYFFSLSNLSAQILVRILF